MLNIKKLVENEFKSVQKYFPNTSILPTHTIENGKIIPRMGTYHCCLLEFSPNNTYGIDDEYLIGIKVEIDDDLNIKLYTATLNSDQFFNNKFFNILEAFKTKILIQDFYFEGSYDPQSITSKTQKQLLEVIKDIKS